jgi:hypothetical protein
MSLTWALIISSIFLIVVTGGVVNTMARRNWGMSKVVSKSSFCFGFRNVHFSLSLV